MMCFMRCLFLCGLLSLAMMVSGCGKLSSALSSEVPSPSPTPSLAGVYAAGFSTNSSGVSVPGYWKDSYWNALTPLDATKESSVMSVVVSGSDVYAGGHSTNSAGVLVPGYWKNGTWTALTGLDETKSSAVYSIYIKSALQN